MRKVLENQSASENAAAAGEVILVTTQGPMAGIQGVPLCLATLAYMEQVEKRRKFILAVRSLQRKGVKPRGVQLPAALRPAFPQMRTRKAEAAWNMGRKRIHHRIRMGSIAWSVFAGDGICFLYQEATPEGKIGLELRGMPTLTAAVCEILRQREEAGRRVGAGASDSHDPAVANEMHLWAESMPVLHLAMSVYRRFQDFDPSLSDDYKLFCLLHTWEWLSDTLTFAEQLRLILPGRIPRFDPDKALRLTPAESQ